MCMIKTRIQKQSYLNLCIYEVAIKTNWYINISCLIVANVLNLKNESIDNVNQTNFCWYKNSKMWFVFIIESLGLVVVWLLPKVHIIHTPFKSLWFQLPPNTQSTGFLQPLLQVVGPQEGGPMWLIQAPWAKAWEPGAQQAWLLGNGAHLCLDFSTQRCSWSGPSPRTKLPWKTQPGQNASKT